MKEIRAKTYSKELKAYRMKMNTTRQNLGDFIDGQRDCSDGVKHVDRSEAYTKGFGFQYEMNESLANQSKVSI